MPTPATAPAAPLTRADSFRATTWALLLIVAAGAAAYGNSFAGAFQFDDIASIRDNPSIRQLWPLSVPFSPPHGSGLTVEGRPLLNFSLALNYAVSGLRPWSYHLLNLGIHVSAGLALFGLVRRTLLSPSRLQRTESEATRFAAAVAALWLVHPVQTESVTYVIQRAESLAGLFLLLTLYGFVRALSSPRPGRWLVVAVAACLLGMATKETLVVAPLLALLYDRTFVAGSFREAWRQRRFWHGALGCTWLFLALLAVRSGSRGGTFTFTEPGAWTQHGLTQIIAFSRYAALAFWPHPLVFDYGLFKVDQAASILPQAAVVATLLGLTVFALRRPSVAGFLGAWFFLNLAPASVVPAKFQLIAEHRLYLAVGAAVGAVAWLAWHLPARWRLATCVALTLAGALTTAARNRSYHSTFALWTEAVAQRPENFRAYNNLGEALIVAGRHAEAETALRHALRLEPQNPDAEFNLGLAYSALHSPALALEHYARSAQQRPRAIPAYLRLVDTLVELNRPSEARLVLEQVLTLKPDAEDVEASLAAVLITLGRFDEAAAHAQRAQGLNPRYAPAENNLGLALIRQGQIAQGLVHVRRALELDPSLSDAHFNLGVADVAAGLPADAVRAYREAIRLNPQHAAAHLNLGILLFQTGETTEGLALLEAAVRLGSLVPEAHANLGIALAQSGRTAEAVAQYETALQLNPRYAKAHYNLGNALLTLGRYREAEAHFALAVEIDPQFEDAREMRDRVRAGLAAGFP
jgi:tetratricopeptide (TPR) repeat protein